MNSIVSVMDIDGNEVMGVKYKDNYLVTDCGTVYTLKKNGRWRAQRARHHTHGYLRVVINRKDEYVHQIVARCFIENPRGCKEINHKDGDKTNNKVENLEWCTRSENNRHAFQTGLRDYKELSVIANSPKNQERAKQRRRLTFEQAEEIRRQMNVSDYVLSRQYGISRGQIYAIKHGKTYKTA